MYALKPCPTCGQTIRMKKFDGRGRHKRCVGLPRRKKPRMSCVRLW